MKVKHDLLIWKKIHYQNGREHGPGNASSTYEKV